MSRVLAITLLVLGARAASAMPVAIDRDAALQQLQSITQELAIVQQQLEGSPHAREKFAWSLQQLAAAQVQLGDLVKQISTARPAHGGHMGPPAEAVLTPIGEATLRSLVQQISAVGFSDDKVNILRQAAEGNYFLVDQAVRILPLFAHSSDRITALQLLAPRILDRANNFKLLTAFSFSSDRENAQRILESAPPLQVR